MIVAGIDIGGTFTDIAVFDYDSDALFLGKVFTTPDDPSEGALSGLKETLGTHGFNGAELSNVIHGTTLVANVLIERKGVPTALLVTRGFRDLLEIRREKRYQIYNLNIEMPSPLIARRMRVEVDERVDANGTILEDLDINNLTDTIAQLQETGVQAMGVCLLHSYKNDSHERLVSKIISREAPEAYQSLSVDVMPEIREYERMSTTAANAYSQPIVRDYLERMGAGLSALGASGELRVVLSSGGVTSAHTAQRYPVRILESGPAGGAIYAGAYATAKGLDRAVAFDMGGTTAKLCLLRGGTPKVTTDFEVARVDRFRPGSGLPIRLPGIDLIEIGAGGGSIAHVGSTGVLEVGPQSAGADPGPACYGRGGEEPTVTDANLILGYLGSDSFLGGRLRLDIDAAKTAVDQHLADPLGLDLAKAAWGIHEVVTENMASAAQLYAAEQGEDLTNMAFVAFGGAGPVHAYRLAYRLKMSTVICPPGAGVASAIGFLVMPPAFDLVRTHITDLAEIDYALVNGLFDEMQLQGIQLLEEMNIPKSEIVMERSCDMRFVGQGHEISVSLPAEPLSDRHTHLIKEAFDERYLQLYRVADTSLEIEVFNWRVTIRGTPLVPTTTLTDPDKFKRGKPRSPVTDHRPVYFPEIGDYVDCKIVGRYELAKSAELAGPVIIEEPESTVVVGPGGSAHVDELGSIVVTVASRPTQSSADR